MGARRTDFFWDRADPSDARAMNSRALVTEFRNAEWGTRAEAEAFITGCGALNPADMTSLLGVLLKRQDDERHRRRIGVFRALNQGVANRELFVPYVRALRAAGESSAAAIVGLLQAINSVGDHGEVVELFRSQDPQTRRNAVVAFKAVCGKTAFAQLVSLCGDRSFPGRVEAMEAMIEVAGYHALPAIEAVLRAGTKVEKVQALAYLQDEELFARRRADALPLVASQLSDRDDAVAFAAVKAVGALAEESTFFELVGDNLRSGDLRVVRATLEAMARFSSPRAIRELTRVFRQGPRAIRLAVLDTARTMARKEALPLILEGLTHRQLDVRAHAASVLEALAEAGTLSAARAILWLLRSPDVQVKRTAAQLANRIRDPEGKLWPQLFRYLRDEDWWVRERVTDALVEMAGTALTRYAVAYLSDDSEIIRRYGIELLVRLNDPASIGALVRAAGEDEDWWVRERAVEGLGRLADARAVPYIVDLITRQPDLRIIGCMALGEIADASAAPHIAQFAASEDADTALAALRAIAAFDLGTPSPHVAHAVEAAAASTDFRVRQEARALLGTWRVAVEVAAGADRLTPLERMLVETVKAGGDDLILAAGKSPYIKRVGRCIPVAPEPFSEAAIERMLRPLLNESQLAALGELRDVDFSFEVKAESLRFRVNVFNQTGGLSAVFRAVKDDVPKLGSLGLPPVVQGFADLPHGLVLVGGPTGSGKSTTLAAFVDHINERYPVNILTLEDPIEVVHKPKRALIVQREIGSHTHSFANGLRAAFREDPDVILVGEMRDRETLHSALTASETGHLVFGTVHTASADTTVDRIINAFPSEDQPQVRTMLANNLRAICCQHLLTRADGKGRVVAAEVMINSDAIANLIRKGRTYQIANVVATSKEMGMESMDNALFGLVQSGTITAHDAYMKAMSKKEFAARLARDGITSEFISSVTPSAPSAAEEP
jgi:twitching motility protein PilT